VLLQPTDRLDVRLTASTQHISGESVPQIAERSQSLSMSQGEALADMLAEKQPSRRLSSPDEIARLARWLCAPEAHNITGTALPIDGGWTAQ
jgi:3-hydroxybutyrate dehydrogenase